MVVLLSLGAAMCYAAASVLQQQAARDEPLEHSMRATLLLGLLRRPLWLLGRAVDSAGYGLQAAALHAGSLVVVEPLLSVGLLFALALGMIRHEAHVGRREWLGAAALTCGLVIFVLVSAATSTRRSAPGGRWVPVVLVLAAAVALLVRAAERRAPATRATLLAAAGGCLFALTAALTKAALGHWSQGIVHLLSRWELYALIVNAVLGAITVQSAFQAGPLPSSLPTLTAVEPLVSLLLGVVLFREQLLRRPLFAPALIVALGAIAFGILTVGRSPLVAPTRDVPPAHPS